jgi:hypothetical protein
MIQVVEATFSQRHLSSSKLPFYALGKGQQIEAVMAQEVAVIVLESISGFLK